MPCSAVTLSLATITAIIATALLAIAFSTDNWVYVTVNREKIKGMTELLREYEMIWTLFHSTEEEEEARKKAGVGGEEDSIMMRIFKYIFCTEPDQEDFDTYSEKRPYHRHIHQPSKRPPPATAPNAGSNAAAGSTGGAGAEPSDYKRLHADSALVARPPLRPDDFPPQPPLSEQSIPFFPEKLMRLVSTLAVGAGLLAITTVISALNLVKTFLATRWK